LNFQTDFLRQFLNFKKNCPSNGACFQQFRIPIGILNACSFSGTYKARFKLGCHPSITNPSNCPLTGNEEAIIQFDSNSEDFCTQVQMNIELTGTLKSYQESTFQNLKNSFLVGSTSYFKADVASPKATIKSASISRVQFSQNSQTFVLFDQNSVTPIGSAISFQLDSTGASTSAAFQFKLLDSQLNIPVDSSLNYNVSAVVNVEYLANDGSSTFKTGLFSFLSNVQPPTTNNQNGKYANQIQIFGGKNINVNSANKKLMNLFALIFVSLIFLM